MQADDDVPSFQQLVEHAEAFQHDLDQAEHHRQADDDRDPYDAAEHDLIEFVRKHRTVLRRFECSFSGRYPDRRFAFYHDNHSISVSWNGIGWDSISLDEPASGDGSC